MGMRSSVSNLGDSRAEIEYLERPLVEIDDNVIDHFERRQNWPRATPAEYAPMHALGVCLSAVSEQTSTSALLLHKHMPDMSGMQTSNTPWHMMTAFGARRRAEQRAQLFRRLIL